MKKENLVEELMQIIKELLEQNDDDELMRFIKSLTEDEEKAREKFTGVNFKEIEENALITSNFLRLLHKTKEASNVDAMAKVVNFLINDVLDASDTTDYKIKIVKVK